MAHYALVTRSDETAGPWRSCAILVAGGPQGAARQARALRLGGGLAFVPSPSRFRIRRASRGEVLLLLAFFQGMGIPEDAMASQVDVDAGFARRERLLRSFFMGLYLNPEGLRRKYNTGALPPASAPSGSGGAEHDEAGLSVAAEVDQAQEVVPDPLAAASVEVAENASAPLEEGASGIEGGEDAPLSGANQEDALMSILNSAEANDGGHGREQSFDLDIL